MEAAQCDQFGTDYINRMITIGSESLLLLATSIWLPTKIDDFSFNAFLNTWSAKSFVLVGTIWVNNTFGYAVTSDGFIKKILII